MPRVKIDSPGVTVELDANEVSVTELGKQAMEMYREASEINKSNPTGAATGFSIDKRWTPDHHNANSKSTYGFGPVHAQEGG